MDYKKRFAEQKVIDSSSLFKLILLTGARQVGKSSLFAHLFPSLPTFVFDPIQDLYGVKQDPDLFLNNLKGPAVLDEIQYVPELLPALKRKVDLAAAKGQYFLTGSQQLSILKTISESLAGRVSIIELGPMTPQEMYGSAQQETWLSYYLRNPEILHENFNGLITAHMPSLYEVLWRGGMPGTIGIPQDALPTYFSSYIQTYVERDVRLLENIQDLSTFGRFFSLTGALTAQEINYSQLGREIGISPTTAQRWLNLLRYTFQWHEVWPYHGNVIKRISSKSKGYITDTGIACYQHRISSPTALGGHPLLGALFETYCFNMIKGLCSSLSVAPHMYHWRTADGAEVDLILERDCTLYPIVMKCKTNLTGHDTRGIQAFRQTYNDKKIAPALILYAGTRCYWVDKNTLALPWNSV